MEDCEDIKCDMMSYHLSNENEEIFKGLLQMVYFSGLDNPKEFLALAHECKEEGIDLFKKGSLRATCEK